MTTPGLTRAQLARQLAPLAAIAGACLLIGLLIPAAEAVQLFIRYGYWMLLAVSAFCGWLLLRKPWQCNGSLEWRRHSRGILLSAIVATIWQCQEPTEFKTMSDEPVQVGTSMMMHLNKRPVMPRESRLRDGVFAVTEAGIDKRPCLFPLLVSFVHDLTGYRAENAFFVNAALSFLLLVLVYLLGSQLGGIAAGLASVALLGGIPELARMANGAGFEILNMTLMVGLCLCVVAHLRNESADGQDRLCAIAILLAYARYESILFTLTTAGAIALVWWKRRAITLSPGLYAAPVLLVPYLLQNKLFALDANRWQMWTIPDRESPFSVSYVPEQLQSLASYLFAGGHEHPNHWPIGLFGLFAVIVVLSAILLKIRKKESLSIAESTFLLTGIGFGALLLLMLAYSWPLDHKLITRLNLPFYLPLSFTLAVSGTLILRRIRTGWTWLAPLAAALVTLGYGIPKMATHKPSNQYYGARIYHHLKELKAEYGENRFYFLFHQPTVGTVMEIPSLPVNALNEIRQGYNAKAAVKVYLQQPFTVPLLVYETIFFDPATRQTVRYSVLGPDGKMIALDPDFQLETVKEVFDNGIYGYRVSRIVGVEGYDDADPGITDPESFQRFMDQIP